VTEHRSLAAAPDRARRRSLAIGSIVALVLIVLDQVTKEIAEALLEHGRFVPLLGEHIGWQLVYNQGGAFGIPAPHWIFLIVTVIVVVVVARALPRTRSKVTATAYGMLLAGAVGNVIDRIFREGATDVFGGGAVVDFVAWGTFPRFNVADSAITVGFALLVIGLWREERRHHEEARAAETLAQGASEGTGAGHVTVLASDTEGDDVASVPDRTDEAVAAAGQDDPEVSESGDAAGDEAANEGAGTRRAETGEAGLGDGTGDAAAGDVGTADDAGFDDPSRG
jgi:signal peptidase II